MPSRRQSDADKKVMEQPTAEKVMEEKKFSLDEIRKSCMKLFHVTSSTFADLVAQTEELRTALDEIDSKYEETMSGIDDSESSSKSLIAQLVAMQENTNLSGGQLEIMQGIVDRLNNSYEGLNLTLDSTNGKLNMSVEDLWQAVTDSANQEKAQANMDKLMDYIGQYSECGRNCDNGACRETHAAGHQSECRELQPHGGSYPGFTDCTADYLSASASV